MGYWRWLNVRVLTDAAPTLGRWTKWRWSNFVLQRWADKLMTLSQYWANQWLLSGNILFQVSIMYSLIFTFSKCHRNRLFLYFLGTYRISIYSLLFWVSIPYSAARSTYCSCICFLNFWNSFFNKNGIFHPSCKLPVYYNVFLSSYFETKINSYLNTSSQSDSLSKRSCKDPLLQYSVKSVNWTPSWLAP